MPLKRLLFTPDQDAPLNLLDVKAVVTPDGFDGPEQIVDIKDVSAKDVAQHAQELMDEVPLKPFGVKICEGPGFLLHSLAQLYTRV